MATRKESDKEIFKSLFVKIGFAENGGTTVFNHAEILDSVDRLDEIYIIIKKESASDMVETINWANEIKDDSEKTWTLVKVAEGEDKILYKLSDLTV